MENSFSLSRGLEDCKARVVIGFDGFIDEIYHVHRFGEGAFTSLKTFGGYVADKAGRSCSLELSLERRKAGGNMPILSLALANLGVSVHCIGALGYPDMDPVFSEIAEKCDVLSICAPGLCDAVEFDDGKMMLSKNEEIENLNYSLLKEKVGLDRLIDLYEKSDMIALLNWSELSGMQSVWKGLNEEVFPHLSPRPRGLFVDFSDCSGRSDGDICRAVELLREFKKRFTVSVSLNLNEAERIAAALKMDNADVSVVMKHLKETIGCDNLVVHLEKSAAGISNGILVEAETRFIEHPVLTTGGGDNFNAGFLYGLMTGMTLSEALQVGNAAASFYVAKGFSPSKAELEDWIRL